MPESFEEQWVVHEVLSNDQLRETEATWRFDVVNPGIISLSHRSGAEPASHWQLHRDTFVRALSEENPVCSPYDDVIVHRVGNPLEIGTGTFDVYAMGTDQDEHDRRLHLRMPSRALSTFIARTCIAAQ